MIRYFFFVNPSYSVIIIVHMMVLKKNKTTSLDVPFILPLHASQHRAHLRKLSRRFQNRFYDLFMHDLKLVKLDIHYNFVSF